MSKYKVPKKKDDNMLTFVESLGEDKKHNCFTDSIVDGFVETAWFR